MKTIWILVADSSRAKIFEAHGAMRGVHEIETFSNPEGRAHNRDLKTDGSGRYFGKGERNQGHTAAPQVEPVPAAAVVALAAGSVAPPAPAVPEEPVQERSADEPYIETPRCSTCNECTQINNRMFAYDENQQARIVDATAGTFRQLVEAAESCQVAIIHPGKPKNPDEPGLEELLKRAEAFR